MKKRKELRIRRGSDFITISEKLSKSWAAAVEEKRAESRRQIDMEEKIKEEGDKVQREYDMNEIKSLLGHTSRFDPCQTDPELAKVLAEAAKGKAIEEEQRRNSLINRAKEAQRRGSLFSDDQAQIRSTIFTHKQDECRGSMKKEERSNKETLQRRRSSLKLKKNAEKVKIGVVPPEINPHPPPAKEQVRRESVAVTHRGAPSSRRKSSYGNVSLLEDQKEKNQPALDKRRYSVECPALAEDRVATETDLMEAEFRGLMYVASHKPVTGEQRKNWNFRIGPQGLGYYYQNAEHDNEEEKQIGIKKRRNSNIIKCSQGLHHKRQGWGRLAIKALLANDAQLLRSAAAKTAPTYEELRANLQTIVKGGYSWYYDDFRIRAGVQKEPVVPIPGDTLLHLALRNHASPQFVAALLDLGADRFVLNNSNESPNDINPRLLYRADDIRVSLSIPQEEDDDGDGGVSSLASPSSTFSGKVSYTRQERIQAKSVALLPTRENRVHTGDYALRELNHQSSVNDNHRVQTF